MSKDPSLDLENIANELKNTLGEAIFSKNYEEGKAMSLNEGVEYVINEQTVLNE